MNIQEIIDDEINNEALNVVYFHSTFDDFNNFDFSKSILGGHFGSYETAINRLHVKEKEFQKEGRPLPFNGECRVMFAVKLDITNALRLNENRSGIWNPISVFQAIFEKAEEEGLSFIDDNEIDDFWDDVINLNVDGEDINFHDLSLYLHEYKGLSCTDEMEKEFLKDWLKEKGFDAIIYANDFEVGGDSVLVFDEKKVEIINKEQLNPDFIHPFIKKNSALKV